MFLFKNTINPNKRRKFYRRFIERAKIPTELTDLNFQYNSYGIEPKYAASYQIFFAFFVFILVPTCLLCIIISIHNNLFFNNLFGVLSQGNFSSLGDFDNFGGDTQKITPLLKLLCICA